MVEAAAALSALLDRNIGPDQGNAFRAAARNDVSLLRLILDVQPSLLRATDEDGWTLLYAAAKDGGADAVRFLHARGVALDEPDSDGATPMWVAAAYGGAHLVRLLGELGAARTTMARRLRTSPRGRATSSACAPCTRWAP